MVWLKRIWRGAIVVKDGLALIALLMFFGALLVFFAGAPNPGEVRGGALLLDLDGAIVEQPEAVDPAAAITGAVPSFRQYRARDVIHALDTAAKDRAIKAVVLDLDGFVGGGQVVLQDVADAIRRVRAAKKPVLARATAYTDDGYLLAASASEIWLDPMGDVLLTGPGGTRPYFKGLADRLAINVHVYRAGKYKAFVEPYILERQSPEAREADAALYGALWADWQASVKKARPQADFAPLLTDPAGAAAGKDLAQSQLALKLVDKLGDEMAFGKRVAEIVGKDSDKGDRDYNRTDLDAYVSLNPIPSGGDAVGVVTIAGNIVDGEAGPGSAGGDSIATLIDTAATDSSVKALVLRIDSPGGSAFASEKIRRAVEGVKARKKPVIVSMANVAASGGYWIAMGADRIYAEPGTVTGSIGVFGIIPTFERSAARYGVTTDGVRTTPFSGQIDLLGGTTPEVDRLLQAGVEGTYRKFLGLVANARKLPAARVAEIAEGRVWDGGTARQIGLIDAFGSLDEAVMDAAKRVGLDPKTASRRWIEPQPDLLAWLLGDLLTGAPPAQARDAISLVVRAREAELAAAFRDAANTIAGPGVQVRCLACPTAPAASTLAPRTLLNRIFG